jgi:hypothetical protein
MLSSPAQAGTFTEWPVAAGGNGHWYEATFASPSLSPESWFTFAQGRRGYVASVTSAAENAVVYSIATQNGAFTQAVIGGRRGSNYAFGWVSGEPWGFVAWSSGEPNCTCERYLMLYPSGWNDTNSTARSWAIIEYASDCNGDGKVDFGQIVRGQLADTNGNRVPDCCESGGACASMLVEWPVAAGGNGHWYRLDTNQRRWTESRDWAASIGGRLACIESAAEHAWIRSALTTRGTLVNVGGFQQPGSVGKEGGWRWLSGATFDLGLPHGFDDSPCDLGMPDENGEQDFLHLSDDWSYFGDVNDVPYGQWNCASPGWTLVEFDADCNGDGLVDLGQIMRGELSDQDFNGVPDCCEASPSCRPCPSDLDGNRVVDPADVSLLLLDFGPCVGCASDLDGNGVTDTADVSLLLLDFGDCQ